MDGVVGSRRIFNAHRGLQIAAGEKVLDPGKAVGGRGQRRRLADNRRASRAIAAERTAIFEARRDRPVAAAVEAHAAAVVKGVGAGGDVDQADRAQAEFGRQRAGDERHTADKAGFQNAAEAGTPSGSMTPLMRNCTLA